jgi:hypothetical protein
MSKIGVSLKISVNDIDKARLFKGAKNTYLDCTVFIDPENPDQYENHGMITQDVSKEERENGVKGNILGNCKVFWKGEGQQQATQQAPQQYHQQSPPPQNSNDQFDDSEMPF